MSTTTQGDLSVTRVNQDTWYHGFTEAVSTKYWAAAARISIGFVFLWAFLDKNFGWQFTTPEGQGWMFATGDGSPDGMDPLIQRRPCHGRPGRSERRIVD